jgi:hypothetical protein
MKIIYEMNPSKDDSQEPDDFRALRRYALAAMSKHLGCLPELLALKRGIELSRALNQAIRGMSEITQSPIVVSHLSNKCLLLLQMRSDSTLNSSLLVDFVKADFDADFIKESLARDPEKVQMKIYQLLNINNAYLNETQISWFLPLVSWLLGRISGFQAIAQIIESAEFTEQNLAQYQTVCSELFNRTEDPAHRWIILFLFRFLHALPTGHSLRRELNSLVLQRYVKNRTDRAIFALAFSLIKEQTSFSVCLIPDLNSTLYDFLLITQAARSLEKKTLLEIFSRLQNLVWEISTLPFRYLFNAIYFTMAEEQDARYQLFQNLQSNLGLRLHQSNSIGIWEIIYFCRRLLLNHILSDESINRLTRFVIEDGQDHLRGFLAILGATNGDTREVGEVIIRNSPRRCFVIRDRSRFLLYELPLNLSKEPERCSKLRQSYIFPPLYELSTRFQPGAAFLIDRFQSLYQSPPDFQTFSLYCQAFATFCKSQDFVLKLSPEIFNALCHFPADFTDMTETVLATSARPTVLPEPQNEIGRAHV